MVTLKPTCGSPLKQCYLYGFTQKVWTKTLTTYLNSDHTYLLVFYSILPLCGSGVMYRCFVNRFVWIPKKNRFKRTTRLRIEHDYSSHLWRAVFVWETSVRPNTCCEGFTSLLTETHTLHTHLITLPKPNMSVSESFWNEEDTGFGRDRTVRCLQGNVIYTHRSQ